MKRVFKKINVLLASIIMFVLVLTYFSVGAMPMAQAANSEVPTVTKVTPEVLEQLIDPAADGKTEYTENGQTTIPQRETFTPSDRIWQGLPAIGTLGKRLWASWETGGATEPRNFNYCPIAYSDDGGKTWVDPYLIVNNITMGKRPQSPSFWVNDAGNLCMGFGQDGFWILEFNNADAENVEDVTWKDPVKVSNSRITKAPIKVKLADGSSCWMYAADSDANSGMGAEAGTVIYRSDNGMTGWRYLTKVTSAFPDAENASKRSCPEANLVQLNSGRLMLVRRLEKGFANGVEICYSDDYGLTWTEKQASLSEPFIGPGSKFHIQKLPSGNLLMVNHATTSSRENLRIYLSTDDGATWPYKMTLDGRANVSYPFVFVSGEKIYITWDKGRYVEKEIRCSILTEADIKAGRVVSDGSSAFLTISKLNPDYTEIVSTSTLYQQNMVVNVGTTASEITKQLPTTLTCTDNQGNTVEVTGIWRCKGFNSDKEGVQVFTFDIAETSRENVSDARGVLSCVVEIKGQDGLFGSTVGYLLIVAIAVVVCVLVVILLLKRKRTSK